MRPERAGTACERHFGRKPLLTPFVVLWSSTGPRGIVAHSRGSKNHRRAVAAHTGRQAVCDVAGGPPSRPSKMSCCDVACCGGRFRSRGAVWCCVGCRTFAFILAPFAYGPPYAPYAKNPVLLYTIGGLGCKPFLALIGGSWLDGWPIFFILLPISNVMVNLNAERRRDGAVARRFPQVAGPSRSRLLRSLY